MATAIRRRGSFSSNLTKVRAPTMTQQLALLKNLVGFEHRFVKPLSGSGLSVWCNSATDASNIAAGFDPYFELLVTNSASGAFGAHGWTITTGTTSGDAGTVRLLDVAALSWPATAGVISLNNGFDVWMSWVIRTGASVAAVELAAGWSDEAGGLGNQVAALPSDDNDDAGMFVFNPTNSANWRFGIVNDSTATYLDTKVPVAANTNYILTAKMRADNSKVDVYVNNAYAGTTSATVRSTDDSAAAVSMHPTAYVKTSAAAAKAFTPKAVSILVDTTS